MRLVKMQTKPVDYLGRKVKIVLRKGGTFTLHVTGCGEDYFDGFDDERLNLRIPFDEIDCVMG